jgi:hypothetical protein
MLKSTITRKGQVTILDLGGSVQPSGHPEDFAKIRQSVRLAIAKKVAGHG